MKLRQLFEQQRKVAVAAFGRMNPPTIGHEKLVNKIKSIEGDHYLFLSQTQKPKDNPLPFDVKLEFAKKFFPGINVGHPTVRTPIQMLQMLEQLGYTDIVYVAGSDRVEQFEKLFNDYNGKEYNFNSIQVVSAGERDPDADGAEGMSASKMRAAAAAGDFESFAQGVSEPRLAEKLYNAVRKGMGVKDATPAEGVAEDQLEEESARDIILSLLDKFYADMNLPPREGAHTGELDIKSPGTRVWTRGDGTRYREPGRIQASYWADDKKQAEKTAAKFWPWLLKQPGVKSIGQVSGEFGSSPMKDAVSYKGLYFSGGSTGVEFGSMSRYKNPKSVWRQKKDEGAVKSKTHVSPSGVKTNMDPTDDDYEINYGKDGAVAKFRKSQGLDVKTGKKKTDNSVNEIGMGFLNPSNPVSPLNPTSPTSPMNPASPVYFGNASGTVSPADLKILFNVLTGLVTGAAAVGAKVAADNFMSKAKQLAKGKLEVDNQELKSIQNQIKSIYKMLDRAKRPETKEKYEAMLKDAYRALEEIKARAELKAKGTVGEAAYEGNIGLMELFAFFSKAEKTDPDLVTKVKSLIKQGQDKQVWRIVQDYTGTQLKGKEFEGSIKEAIFREANYGKYWCSTDKKWKYRKGPKQSRSS